MPKIKSSAENKVYKSSTIKFFRRHAEKVYKSTDWTFYVFSMKFQSPLLRRAARRLRLRGQTLVEYALILAFVAVVAIAVLMQTGGSIKSTLGTVNVQLGQAQQGGSTGGVAH
jgi:Flp pilus assembly pilin Flp